MKYSLLLVLFCLGSWNMLNAQKINKYLSKDKTKITQTIDSVSYGLGVLMAPSLSQFDELNLEALIKGLYDYRKDADNTKLEAAEANTIIQRYFKELNDKKYEKNTNEEKKFLTDNKEKDGVMTTESGLQYKVITKGSGASPTTSNKVKCHYHGTLMDGTVFDSSVDRGEPIDFSVSGVIQGWTEVLQLMKEGSKWRVWIPAKLAYGERGTRGIEPYSMLIFEIELIEVLK